MDPGGDRRSLFKFLAGLATICVLGAFLVFAFYTPITPCRYCEETGSVIVMRCQACEGARSLTLWQWGRAAIFGAPRR